MVKLLSSRDTTNFLVSLDYFCNAKITIKHHFMTAVIYLSWRHFV